MGLRINEPIRTALRCQVYATVVVALLAGFWGGAHAVLSSLLGGLIPWTAGAAYGLLVSASALTPGDTLRTLFRAEASKITLIVIQLWVVLAAYKSVVRIGLFSAFLISIIIFSLAIFIDRPASSKR
jgi:ATP synthase protein I